MRILTCLFLGLLAFLLPLVIRSNYWLYMFTLVGIYIILVASLDLIYGYTGMVSLGHGAFFGIGAYACGILQTKLGFPFLPALLLGTLFTCSVSAVLGWPMLRIKGPYFALGTLALGLMVTIVIHNWDSLTGGVSLSGIPLPPVIQFLGCTIDFSSKRTYYYFVLLFVVSGPIFSSAKSPIRGPAGPSNPSGKMRTWPKPWGWTSCVTSLSPMSWPARSQELPGDCMPATWVPSSRKLPEATCLSISWS